MFCDGLKRISKGKETFIVVNNITDGENSKEEVFEGNRFYKYYNTNEIIKNMTSEAVVSGHGEKTVDKGESFVPDFANSHSEDFDKTPL